MCLNLPFEVKNQLIFYKMRYKKVYLNILFVIQYIRCFKNFWGSANILLQIPFKMGENEEDFEDFESSIFFEAQEYFVFESRLDFFFKKMVTFAKLFQRCQTLRKSTLKMTTLFRRCLRLFNSRLKHTRLFQRY